MKGRNLGARCAVLVTSVFAFGGASTMLAAAPAAADMVPPYPPCGTCATQFTIEKLQEIAGSKAGFTTAALTAKAGQTVDYEIVVTNTGHTPITLNEFTDVHCEEGTLEGGPGSGHVVPGSSTTYTCSRHLPGPGVYTNQATVTGESLFGAATETSNTVVVEVPKPPTPPSPPKLSPTPGFAIEKSQEIAGSKAGFTSAPLEGALGETVDYQIVVKNTGNVALKFSSFSDAQCDQPTIAGGPGEGSVAPGTSTTYTCSHLLATSGKYVNRASVTGAAQGLAPITGTSNPVEVNVPMIVVKAVCEHSVPTVHGATGAKNSVFNVKMSSAFVQLLTVYLDGHKLKTFHPSQARNGKFSITIDPRKLSHGAHTVTIKGTSSDPNCKIAAASSFVRPFTAVRKPPFTG
jgi:hypothetical protein